MQFSGLNSLALDLLRPVSRRDRDRDEVKRVQYARTLVPSDVSNARTLVTYDACLLQ